MKECNEDLEKEEWQMIYYRKKMIKDDVFRIMKEAQGSDNWNGIAKRWVSSVFEIVQFCTETDALSDSQKSILQSLRHTTSGRKSRKILINEK